MPELPEVEVYRQLAEQTVGRTIETVIANDSWFLKRSTTDEALQNALDGESFVAARRIGKLLLLDVGNGHVLGLRFGMTGRLVVDDIVGIDELRYSSRRVIAEWDRFVVVFQGGGRLAINDARRLGGVELDPDVRLLGPDALSVTKVALRGMLAGSAVPLKARLMDQRHLAGVGNLIADETLWNAGLDPARPAKSLDGRDVGRLHRALERTLHDLIDRGGSHMGDLSDARHVGGLCPKDGTPLIRRTVGGRTTFSCPSHQH